MYCAYKADGGFGTDGARVARLCWCQPIVILNGCTQSSVNGIVNGNTQSSLKVLSKSMVCMMNAEKIAVVQRHVL